MTRKKFENTSNDNIPAIAQIDNTANNPSECDSIVTPQIKKLEACPEINVEIAPDEFDKTRIFIDENNSSNYQDDKALNDETKKTKDAIMSELTLIISNQEENNKEKTIDDIREEVRSKISFIISEPEEISFFQLIEKIRLLSESIARKEQIGNSEIQEFFTLMMNLTKNLSNLINKEEISFNIETILNSYKTVLKMAIDITEFEKKSKEELGIDINIPITLSTIQKYITEMLIKPSLVHLWITLQILEAKEFAQSLIESDKPL